MQASDKTTQPEIIYANLSGDQEGNNKISHALAKNCFFIISATVIESLCVSCENQGKTSLLLATIPFFKGKISSNQDCQEYLFQ